MAGRTAIIKGAEEGGALWFNNDLLTFKATSEETEEAFIVFEELSQRGKVTPLHSHPDVDETFYVLEGEILVHADGAERAVGGGGFASVPRGSPHALLVTSEIARILTLITPGIKEMELFFREAGEPAKERALPPKGPLAIERIGAAAERYGSVLILGPPPFDMSQTGAASTTGA